MIHKDNLSIKENGDIRLWVLYYNYLPAADASETTGAAALGLDTRGGGSFHPNQSINFQTNQSINRPTFHHPTNERMNYEMKVEE